MKKYLVFYLVILFLGAILPINGTNSTLNNNYILNIRWDYLIHAVVYLPMFPLLMLGFYSRNTNPDNVSTYQPKNKTLIVLIISLLIAMSLEGIQYLIYWRTFNVNDLMGNVVGVGVGVVLNKMNFIKLKKYVK